jgi:IS5 family transposase
LFLDEMNQVVPWAELEALVEPHYPKAGSGRRPVGLPIMLRVYFVQQWFNLSDPGVEEALYESAVLRRFVGVDLGVAPAPDETTICRFRHLLERHELGGQMLDAVNHIWTVRASILRPVRSSMRRLSTPLRRPRTRAASATRRCIRPAKADSGASA